MFVDGLLCVYMNINNCSAKTNYPLAKEHAFIYKRPILM